MDAVLMAGIAVGLVAGSLGFVLARYTLAPLLRYLWLKRRIEALVTQAEDGGSLEAVQNHARTCALALQELLAAHLPRWYRLALKNRGENPEEAVRHLQYLAGCREPGALRRRAVQVRTNLQRQR
jgi:hypothetical protein